ncbi:MAG: hypothetical protein NC212_08530 [Staphylococcus sp.]|nr:hypothetical protein [Staphylococcus sp.]
MSYIQNSSCKLRIFVYHDIHYLMSVVLLMRSNNVPLDKGIIAYVTQ